MYTFFDQVINPSFVDEVTLEMLWAAEMTHVLEHLPSKRKALSSNLVTKSKAEMLLIWLTLFNILIYVAF
jgi:hypothetical protein